MELTQINHLSPERRRIGSVTLRHRWHLLLKWKGVHRTGSIPTEDRARAALISDVAGAMQAYVDDDGLAAPVENHVVVAYK